MKPTVLELGPTFLAAAPAPGSRVDPDGRPPVWLLDVDGVLNAVARAEPSAWQEWRRVRAKAGGTSWPILFAPAVCAFVNRTHRSGAAEIRWLATWGEAARGHVDARHVGEHLLIAPDPQVGLTPADLRTIQDFLDPPP